MITISVPNARQILDNEPKSLLPCPPAILFMATGINVMPIIVTTEPVTTGGKKRTNLPKYLLIKMTNSPEARMEPYIEDNTILMANGNHRAYSSKGTSQNNRQANSKETIFPYL